MLFPTIDFALFFAVVFPITWLLNRHNTSKKWFLVLASYFFYSVFSRYYLLILFFSSVFNFYLALLIAQTEQRAVRRALLWFGIAVNLGVLGYFKYYNFFAATTINLFAAVGFHVSIGFIEVALPIAISFLTFHALSYIIDVYEGRLKPTSSLLDILFYISFFPHLVAGPIVRAKAFLAQTAVMSDPRNIRIGRSVFLIVGGLFKKVVIANYISTDFVDGIFQSPTDFSRLDLLLGMYAYAIQIYCDFSAYTDIAIGIANLLGYEFPQNFNQPYRALSVRDFWRRWHITLSNWLRDYLYIPLGGGRVGKARVYFNLMVTMGLGGLWHGASTNFVIWGLMHGGALVVERLLGAGDFERPRPLWRKALAWFVTFHFVCVTWVFFRSATLDAAMDYFHTLIFGPGWGTTVSPLVVVLLLLGAVTQIVPLRLYERLEAWYDRAPLVSQIAVPAAVILLTSICAPSGIAPFIYFQF